MRYEKKLMSQVPIESSLTYVYCVEIERVKKIRINPSVYFNSNQALGDYIIGDTKNRGYTKLQKKKRSSGEFPDERLNEYYKKLVSYFALTKKDLYLLNKLTFSVNNVADQSHRAKKCH
jgi:hypothetical protein